MRAAQMAAIEHMTGDVYRVGCDLERELNAANTIIRQQQLLDEENLRLQERIKRLEEDLMDAKNKHATLVADFVLYEDRGERIKRLEEAGDALANTQTYDLLETVNWRKSKEAKP
jgi:predicted RNase H-like nuclease (RuvC/YqgF family)